MVYRILRPDSMSVWKNEEILRRFSYYRGIIDGTRIARYLIARTLECHFNPNDSLENLEKLFNGKSVEFNQLINKHTEQLKIREFTSPNYIDLAETIANKYLESCIFCERECGANRIANEK
ncbi:MAG: hypothetical protein ACFFDK_15065, partial [Promethearchaeota archaeon]